MQPKTWRAPVQPCQIPPSVSCHAGHAATPDMSLSHMVIRQARWTARAIDEAARAGRLLDVRNPEWREDRFTDRWPENATQQLGFARALHDLANGLEAIKQGDVQLEDLQDWLRSRFGERVVSRSLKTFNERSGRAICASGQSYTRSGGLFVPAAPATIGAASMVSPVVARPHTHRRRRHLWDPTSLRPVGARSAVSSGRPNNAALRHDCRHLDRRHHCTLPCSRKDRPRDL